MSPPAVSHLSRWLPTIVAIIGCGSNIAYTARWAGNIETRMNAVEHHAHNSREHMPLEQKMSLFWTRQEAETQIRMRDATFVEIKEGLKDIIRKVDDINRNMPRSNNGRE